MVERLEEYETAKKEEEKKKKKLEIEMREEEKELMKKEEERRREILEFEEVRAVVEKAREKLRKGEGARKKVEPPGKGGEEEKEMSFEEIVRELEDFLKY